MFFNRGFDICHIENTINVKYCLFMKVFFLSHLDQLRNSYQVGNDHSLRVIYANGMDTHYQTEPHILAGMQSWVHYAVSKMGTNQSLYIKIILLQARWN